MASCVPNNSLCRVTLNVDSLTPQFHYEMECAFQQRNSGSWPGVDMARYVPNNSLCRVTLNVNSQTPQSILHEMLIFDKGIQHLIMCLLPLLSDQPHTMFSTLSSFLSQCSYVGLF